MLLKLYFPDLMSLAQVMLVSSFTFSEYKIKLDFLRILFPHIAIVHIVGSQYQFDKMMNE